MRPVVSSHWPYTTLHADPSPGSSQRDEDVDVVIPVKSPDMEWLNLTLGSLEQQTHQPSVTVVDCMEPPVEVETSLPSRVLAADQCSTSLQRRIGVDNTDGDVLFHLDEDAVLTRPDHIERGLERLEEPEVSAVGGTVAPIRGNRVGKITSSLSPVSAWFPMHYRDRCPTGRECFGDPDAVLGMFHNDDARLKRRLFESGEVVEDANLVVLTDLPTRKQKTGAAVAGAVLVASGSFLR